MSSLAHSLSRELRSLRWHLLLLVGWLLLRALGALAPESEEASEKSGLFWEFAPALVHRRLRSLHLTCVPSTRLTPRIGEETRCGVANWWRLTINGQRQNCNLYEWQATCRLRHHLEGRALTANESLLSGRHSACSSWLTCHWHNKLVWPHFFHLQHTFTYSHCLAISIFISIFISVLMRIVCESLCVSSLCNSFVIHLELSSKLIKLIIALLWSLRARAHRTTGRPSRRKVAVIADRLTRSNYYHDVRNGRFPP